MIVIGDVHGCFKTLVALLDRLPKDEDIYLVGDYIDRGPSSRHVISYLMFHKHLKPVRGNHEDMVVKAYYESKHIEEDLGYDPYYRNMWMYNGGLKCLESYGENHLGAPYQGHLEFMKSLPLYYETDEAIICHSGNIEDPWDRYGVTDSEKVIIHGHTPLVEPYITQGIINVDTGCVFNDYGKLTAIQYPSLKVWQEINIDND